MKLRHVGLISSSEKNSDKFFGKLLGLEKLEPKTLPASLSQAIFRVNADLKVINYASHHAHFEIFIGAPENSGVRPVEHVCLDVDDLAAFLQKCRSLKVSVLQVPKGDSLLTFIKDDDDNLFEIKEKIR
jgi:catechol 2,3-dioxygenase-like lactoylglutathione lyase family enzyme